MRGLIAMLKHETNTFSPLKTDLERFHQWTCYENQAVVEHLTGTNTALGGFLSIAQEREDQLITPIAAEAMPSGPASDDTFTRLSDLILSATGDVDYALLDLHGAMVTASLLDPEGELLNKITQINPDLPIAVTFDFHANVSETIVQKADILTGYHTYPHVDMAEAGLRAARLLFGKISGDINPVMSFGRLAVLPHTLRQGTDDEPFKSLMQMCREKEKLKGILDISLFGGFPLADTPYTAPSLVVISDDDQAMADRVRDEILDAAQTRSDEFVYQGEAITSALARAKEHPGPLVLLDHSDNCGSGGTQDVMTAIAAVMESGLKSVAVATVWDPHAVQVMEVAGVGETITIDLGGKTDLPALDQQGQPLALTGRVKTLTDGRWVIHGEMYNGVEVNMGPTAIFQCGELEIIITSRHIEPWDKGIFIACGINPEQKRYLLLKSRIHHRASFRTLTPDEILLDGEGVTTSDYSLLNFQHLPEV